MVAFVNSFAGAALRPAFKASAHASRPTARRAKWTMEKSKSIPFLEAQPGLNKNAIGYTGFDPAGLSNYLDQDYAQCGEVKNGRVAMLACLGMIVQEFVHLPGGPAFSETNPLKAIHTVPVEGWIQIITFISIIELATFKRTYAIGADLGFDPLGMGANDDKMKLREVKNGRLAMIGAIGMIFQTAVFGEGPISQLQHIGSIYSPPGM